MNNDLRRQTKVDIFIANGQDVVSNTPCKSFYCLTKDV